MEKTLNAVVRALLVALLLAGPASAELISHGPANKSLGCSIELPSTWRKGPFSLHLRYRNDTGANGWNTGFSNKYIRGYRLDLWVNRYDNIKKAYREKYDDHKRRAKESGQKIRRLKGKGFKGYEFVDFKGGKAYYTYYADTTLYRLVFYQIKDEKKKKKALAEAAKIGKSFKVVRK